MTFAWVTPLLLQQQQQQQPIQQPRQQQQQQVRLCFNTHIDDDDDDDDPGALERYRKRQLRRRSQQQQQQRRRRRIPTTPPVSINNHYEKEEEGRHNQHIVSQDLEGNNNVSFVLNSEQQPTFICEKEEGFNNSDEIIIRTISQNNERIAAGPALSNLSEESSLQQHNDDSVITNEPGNHVVSSLNQLDSNTTNTRLSSLFGTRPPTHRRFMTLVRVSHALKQTAQRSWQRSMKRIIRRQAVKDEDSIQDVDYHYVRRDPIDIMVPMEEDNRTFDYARIPKVRPKPERVRQLGYPSQCNSMTNTSVPTLPQYRPKRSRPASELKSASTRKRRIYNPYNKYDNNKPFEDMDSVDRIGQFLADTVDQFFWGKYDIDDVKQDAKRPPPRKRQRPAKQAYNKTAQSFSRPQHWKDRLEERFDSIMGIHEDGNVYNRWFQNEQEKEIIPRKRSVNKKPFWEEEGSLIALLLGRTKDGERLSWEKALAPRGGDGSLVTIFRTVLQTTFVLASYGFRWASVRGAIPQPVVVLGVSAAGLCVRQHRIRSMLLALILFRTVGELVHGGLYGQDGWEDDTDESP
ncbi:hypothetical protein FisN_29Lh031 [Fistulifera solaris]|uniref:Uncharacterized protein n=1 Tax=Fistulifera solaris TaxID=1519565 RepID=A0A1Z5JLC9_FISSO|nr:hypothetical protein FisN_29Lh031 [Fistulifera solaris]|eukprot:GAX14825.1 hypothetical protein FisN_29Lh031 [Fistulifera solaris]